CLTRAARDGGTALLDRVRVSGARSPYASLHGRPRFLCGDSGTGRAYPPVVTPRAPGTGRGRERLVRLSASGERALRSDDAARGVFGAAHMPVDGLRRVLVRGDRTAG